METTGSAGVPDSNGSKYVLVVDDDPLQRGEIVDFLTRQGIVAVSEDNGFAAFHQIRKCRPRVVVMDINMPGLDGLQVSRLVFRLGDYTKIILMSGYPEFVLKAHREDADIFAVIEKPVPLRALARFINEALDSPGN